MCFQKIPVSDCFDILCQTPEKWSDKIYFVDIIYSILYKNDNACVFVSAEQTQTLRNVNSINFCLEERENSEALKGTKYISRKSTIVLLPFWKIATLKGKKNPFQSEYIA